MNKRPDIRHDLIKKGVLRPIGHPSPLVKNENGDWQTHPHASNLPFTQ